MTKDITIINKYIDADRKTQYKISYVKKDFWSFDDGISINGTQIRKNYGYYAAILISEDGYQSPKDFWKSQRRVGHYETKDYLVKGKVENFTTIKQLLKNIRK